MNETGQPDSDQNLEAPAELVAVLKEASKRGMFVPAHVDRTILKAAQAHLDRSSRSSSTIFWRWLLWPAFAAVCFAVWAIFFSPDGVSSTQRIKVDYAREDLNHDGQVDILDSFALARQLKSGKSLPAAYDINGDGVVDERDVQLLAARAVKLDKSTRS